MRVIVTVMLVLGLGFSAWSQLEMRKYAIVVGKKDTLGYLKLTKAENNDTVNYHYNNSISFTFFKKFNISSELTTRFFNEYMYASKASHYFNGSIYKNSNHQWDGKNYRVKNEKGKEYELEGKIDFTAIQLFFQEPEGREEVYSETNCAFQPVKQLEEGKYEMIKSDGTLNEYSYKKGVLYKVYVENPLRDFHLLLVDAIFRNS